MSGASIAAATIPTEVLGSMDSRDPQLRAFEQYLLSHMRASDVTTDSEGAYLFNVNQVAYLVEGSSTTEQKFSTRRRVHNGLPGLTHITRRLPPSNKGKMSMMCF